VRCPPLYLGSLYWLKLVIQIFLYLLAVDDVNICINRVKLRVEQGGHNVNPDVIKQRYTTGLVLIKHYKDFPDVLILLDNSDGIAKTEL
jgi:predicted ABC-type ATPase